MGVVFDFADWSKHLHLVDERPQGLIKLAEMVDPGAHVDDGAGVHSEQTSFLGFSYGHEKNYIGT